MSMKKLSLLLGTFLLLAMILFACGASDPDQIFERKLIEAYDIGETGSFSVLRIKCLYAIISQGMNSPTAYYVTYAWLNSNDDPPQCLETFSELPLRSGGDNINQIGFTDMIPAEIRFVAAGLYKEPVN